ncbi:MAG TPA: PQQ-binding-like beta-propeller repeat protein [Candidatus Dormibacteraeota bacterium]|nr:PQQ-binding-like beta-propeller repeat protein [Candidatus Dormibacteraeota bacterium]
MTKPTTKRITNSAAIWRVVFVLFLILAGIGTAGARSQQAGGDWPQFGLDLASSSASAAPTGITAANIPDLTLLPVKLDGTVDASAIYLHGVIVKGSRHDVFFVTTTYGKTIAVDAGQGSILWEYTPPKYTSWAGTYQITNSTPVADPDRQFIYAAAPDGTVRKLAVSDGHVLWTTPITLLPQREKIASPLRYFRGRIIAVTGGYVGDQPPYQGHVAILDARTGKLLHVWNSLCSDRQGLLNPASCPDTRSAIWGRAGAVIDPATGNIFVATGNGPYDGKTNWGDALIELDPDATRILGNYTPKNNAKLNDADLDLGSTSPVLLGGGYVAQSGKAGLIHLLSMEAIAGVTPHLDHERQNVYAPSGSPVFTAPAVWHHDGETWMFIANNNGTDAWALQKGQLVAMWKNGNRGTSPVLAGGLLYVYDPRGALRIYNPLNGTVIAELRCGSGHWNSPIVVKGKIALPEGNANQHATSGVLDIWSLPDPIN